MTAPTQPAEGLPELLPLPSEPKSDLAHWDHTDMKDYARANVEAATEALRAKLAACRRKWSYAESDLAACDGDLHAIQARAELAERERDELREALREAATRIEATLASNTLISKYADAELAKIARRARAALGGDGGMD